MAKAELDPHISITQIGGKQFFRLTFWAEGKRKREHFSKKGDASKRLAMLLAEKKKHGMNWVDLPLSLRVQAIEAKAILAGTGMTLPDAARMAMAGIADKVVLIPAAVDEFLRSRQHRTANYRASLERTLGGFAKSFPTTALSSIKPADCDFYLDGIEGMTSASTRNAARTDLTMLFRRGIEHGYCLKNPIRLTALKDTVLPPPNVLAPADCRRLLECCHPRLLPALVFGLFTFIRQKELERLDWSFVTVDESGSFVRLSSAITKTKRSRKVDIPACALTWLPHPLPQSGRVLVNGFEDRQAWMGVRLAAGFGPYVSFRGLQPDAATLRPWKRNTLRQTGISYLLAATRDYAQVEYEAGNSANVIRQHYDGLASAADAAKFFDLTRSPR